MSEIKEVRLRRTGLGEHLLRRKTVRKESALQRWSQCHVGGTENLAVSSTGKSSRANNGGRGKRNNFWLFNKRSKGQEHEGR